MRRPGFLVLLTGEDCTDRVETDAELTDEQWDDIADCIDGGLSAEGK